MTYIFDCGSLHTREQGRNRRAAFVVAVRRCRPRHLGRLVRIRKLCCQQRTHGPHFIAYWWNPVPTLRRAGLLTTRSPR